MKKLLFLSIIFYAALPGHAFAQTDNFSWVCLYYTDSFGPRPTFTILFNDKETVQLEKKGRARCKVYSTGNITISCYYTMNKERNDRGFVVLNVEHGKTYYVKLDNPRLKLVIVDEAAGKEEFNNSKMKALQNFNEDLGDPFVKTSATAGFRTGGAADTSAKKKTVAVLEFSSSSPEVGKNELATLTNRFRTILVKTNVYDVLERQKMGDILKEQDFTLSDACNSAECAVQVGQLLGVEYMIAGDIGKLGNTYSVDLRLISVTSGKILQTESQDHDGKIDGLFGALTAIGDYFAGIKSKTSTVTKTVETAATADIVDHVFTDPRDGKKYNTVTIGDQTWMAQNLNYDAGEGSFCYYLNSGQCRIYGRLYTWEAAMKAVPSGWHIPTDDEWIELISYVGENEAGSKLKDESLITWGSHSAVATNETGFTALPGGFRTPDGAFMLMGTMGIWWSATEAGVKEAWNWVLKNDVATIYRESSIDKNHGCSVRLVKD